MATPVEVAKSIQEHIYSMIDKRERAKNSGNIKEEKRTNKKRIQAKKYLEDYKADFGLT
mgnify:CR=1 FL=1